MGGGSRLGGMEDDGPMLSIGELARRAGLPVRTIRFWSDAGVRLYDAACVVRLELIVTLRELGLGLADMRRVLGGQASIAEVAAVHLQALDAQIRALRLHRAVTWLPTNPTCTPECRSAGAGAGPGYPARSDIRFRWSCICGGGRASSRAAQGCGGSGIRRRWAG